MINLTLLDAAFLFIIASMYSPLLVALAYRVKGKRLNNRTATIIALCSVAFSTAMLFLVIFLKHKGIIQ